MLFRESLLERIERSEFTLYVSESVKRSDIDPDDFGLPKERKYPMHDEKHVRLAIKFFNHVEKDKEKELAKNIKIKMKEYNINDIEVGPNNRFKNYL